MRLIKLTKAGLGLASSLMYCVRMGISLYREMYPKHSGNTLIDDQLDHALKHSNQWINNAGKQVLDEIEERATEAQSADGAPESLFGLLGKMKLKDD